MNHEPKDLDKYLFSDKYDIVIDGYGAESFYISKFKPTIFNSRDPFMIDLVTFVKQKRDIEGIIDEFPRTLEYRQKLFDEIGPTYNPAEEENKLIYICKYLFLICTCDRGIMKIPNVSSDGNLVVSEPYQNFKTADATDITISNIETLDLIKQHKDNPRALIYLDPFIFSRTENMKELMDFVKQENFKATVLIRTSIGLLTMREKMISKLYLS